MRIRRKTHLKTGIELAPLVDTLFVLLTYFLINTTLDKNSSIKVQLPSSASAQADEQNNYVIYITGDKKIYLNEELIESVDLPSRLKQINDKNEAKVTIKGDKTANYQDIISILDQVNQAGITHFNLSTEKQ